MRFSLFISIFVLVVSLCGCQADMDSPGLQAPQTPLSPNTSIIELKTLFEDLTAEVPIRHDGSHFVIHGRVISSDADGNIYKTIVIQDNTAALAFSINQWGLFNSWRIGQDVVIDMTGLFLGYYAGLQLAGFPEEPYNGVPQLGYMAYDYWLAHAFPDGLPDPECRYVEFGSNYPSDCCYCITFDNFSPLSLAPLPLLQSQLVELRNVEFVISDGKDTFAPPQENANRRLRDNKGHYLTMRNSGYATFHDAPLPTGRLNVRGILSYFNNSWQLQIRTLDDITAVAPDAPSDPPVPNGDGTFDAPYSVAHVMQTTSDETDVWIEGYVAGYVAFGDFMSGACFSPEETAGSTNYLNSTNVILSEVAPAEASLTNSVPAQLAAASRPILGLRNNPGIFGRKVKLRCNITSFLGTRGIRNISQVVEL